MKALNFDIYTFAVGQGYTLWDDVRQKGKAPRVIEEGTVELNNIVSFCYNLCQNNEDLNDIVFSGNQEYIDKMIKEPLDKKFKTEFASRNIEIEVFNI